jgi:hypothetical protein
VSPRIPDHEDAVDPTYQAEHVEAIDLTEKR